MRVIADRGVEVEIRAEEAYYGTEPDRVPGGHCTVQAWTEDPVLRCTSPNVSTTGAEPE